MRYLLIVLIVFIVGLSELLVAQSSVYSGKVFTVEDEEEETLIGASVRVPGNYKTVMTDMDGNFTISIPDTILPVVLVNYGCSIDGEPAFLIRKGRENALEINYNDKRPQKRRNRKLRKLWQKAGMDPELFW